MKSVRLLYFEGCPNVEQARQNLRAALERQGLPARWEETDLHAAGCPAQWKGFPSPTVLVDGVDVVTGTTSQAGASSCRFGGAPDADLILGAVKERPRLWSLAALPAALSGLLPATFCPACYPALAGLLGALGLGAYAERLMAPVTLILLAFAVAGLGLEARRNGEYRPVVIGAAGSGLLYAGQFAFACAPVKFIGVALLTGACFWNVHPRLKRRGEICDDCAE